MTNNTTEPTTTTLLLLQCFKMAVNLTGDNFSELLMVSPDATPKDILHSIIEIACQRFKTLTPSQYNILLEDVRKFEQFRLECPLPEYMSTVVEETADHN